MTLHLHVGRQPYTITIARGKPGQSDELADKTDALLWYALRMVKGGELARYVLRKYSGAKR